jgi:hypothetical protein
MRKLKVKYRCFLNVSLLQGGKIGDNLETEYRSCPSSDRLKVIY